MVSPARAILNGTDDNGTHPNVGVMYMADRPVLQFGMCSGSLLSADEFLVAGHCTELLSTWVTLGLLTKDEVFVSFDEQISYDGSTGYISSAHPVHVTGWDIHPAYGPAQGIVKNDVGVIHLATAQTAAPIELPDSGFLDTEAARGGLNGHEFVTVGYGINSIDRSMNNFKKADFTLAGRRMVAEPAFTSLASNTLHVKGLVCGGDSGGPKFWGGDAPNLVVALTASGSAACGPDASQRLDLQSVLDFLAPYH